jgi:hypothetical protein
MTAIRHGFQLLLTFDGANSSTLLLHTLTGRSEISVFTAEREIRHDGDDHGKKNIVAMMTVVITSGSFVKLSNL